MNSMSAWTFRALRALIYKGSERDFMGTPYIYIRTLKIGVLTVHARQERSKRMVDKLKVVDAETLLATPLKKTMYIVNELIPEGLSVICGDSKIGKSWLMLWLGLQVSQGKDLWGYATTHCDVLYLALEDTYRRLQKRLYFLTGENEAPKNFNLCIMSKKIGEGLEEQIVEYINEYYNTKLIIIDTLQKVRDSRGSMGKNGMYGNDYDDISAIKNIADKYGIAIILVHHLRKLTDSNNPFNQISGSTALMGAADTAYLLKKDWNKNNAQLIANGRDIGQFDLELKFENGMWNLLEVKSMEDLEKEAVPEFLYALCDFMKEAKEWSGTATQLLNVLGDSATNPNMVTKSMGKFTADFLTPRKIEYQTKRTNKERLIYLKYCDNGDSSDSITSTVTPVTPSLEKEQT